MGSAEFPPYFLSKQTHIALAGNTLFLLDEASGKYLSLPRESAACLSTHILGWPIVSDRCTPPPILRALIDKGLVTNDPAHGKSAIPAKVSLPMTWLRDGQPRGRPQFKIVDIYRFFVSVGYAVLSKRLLHFRKIVSLADKSRKSAPPAGSVSIESLAALVRIFDWLRPFAFKKTDECFLYCWALSRFLGKYGIYPSWVFAVQEQPFAAHCWLQHESYVLTDIPFNLRRMTPILVI
ncbi:lasso peptide biosynthesis B2 protein [Microbulbifer elongatus]|uniref:Lasso peptide biosynthesis B2 protein n=2 Tax=Microbulbifer elongatus TaxID=86173 RepID=A0ABT1P2B5_9GAMM|nr:lasso peptide biosynthesis B2 protein [Microbulbifer elongatus]